MGAIHGRSIRPLQFLQGSRHRLALNALVIPTISYFPKLLWVGSEPGMGRWVMGHGSNGSQMDHMGHGSLGVDHDPSVF